MYVKKLNYFLRIVDIVASESTCLDKQVGCLLVDRNGNILATGYNGAPRGLPHCTDTKVCEAERFADKSYCVAAHAEQNALLRADPDKIHACITTLEPCIMCTRMLMNTSCKLVIYKNPSKTSGQWLWRKKNAEPTWRYES